MKKNRVPLENNCILLKNYTFSINDLPGRLDRLDQRHHQRQPGH
jgi:hypothetical protein